MSPSWFETIKVHHGSPMALPYHQARIDHTIGRGVLDIARFISSMPLPNKVLHRMRIDYDRHGHVFSSILAPYKKRIIRTLRIIEISGFRYSSKSTNRSFFDQAKLQSNTDEIIFTQNGFVTDTTFSNLLFGDGSIWVAPETFLLNGTKRQQLLDQGIIGTAPVKKNNIHNFKYCSLINAMLDPGDMIIPTNQIIS